MKSHTKFFINGSWVAPDAPREFPVINPATEEAVAVISLGDKADTDRAVDAAKKAFASWRLTSPEERLLYIRAIRAELGKRSQDMAEAIRLEMGAPLDMAQNSQEPSGTGHTDDFLKVLENFEYEIENYFGQSNERIIKEPIGVCALITPWNWPMNQISLKVIPAIAVGCTVVLKPSEIAPLSAIVFSEVMEAAGLPSGVYNMINGDGAGVGSQLSEHPDVDMVSFTGSTRAGRLITKAGADTIKRVALELGGKGANIIFADADAKAVTRGARSCFYNSGQSCNAPTRMLVERSRYEEAVEEAAKAAETTAVGDPAEPGRHIGPVVSEAQFEKIQALIGKGIKEARLVAGGLGKPEGLTRGYYVRPTVFSDVTNDMTIAREEVFGPVLSIIPFEDEAEAIEIANDTEYGLTNYIQTSDPEKARRVARAMRSGMVRINGTDSATPSPFGGYKQSGSGREGGAWGLEEFLETKHIAGWM